MSLPFRDKLVQRSVTMPERESAHLSRFDGGVVHGNKVGRDAVAPPQLARDAPVPVGDQGMG